MTDKEKLDAIRAEIRRLVDVRGYDREMANDLFTFMDSLPNEPVSEPNKELTETYLAVFNKKFPILPSLKDKQLADYKNFLNKCQQIFGLKEWGIRPIQSKLFEKLTLLWAVWGAEHLQGVGRQDEKEQDIPVSEDLEKVSYYFACMCHPLETAYSKTSPNPDVIKAFKAGAKWSMNQAKVEIQAQSMALAHGCPKESITENLGEYINELSKQFPEVSFAKLSRIAVRVAKWQKENLWKLADGDDLPEIDREVIVFTQPYPLEGNEYVVSFAHRPNPDGWDGKSLTTGEVEHYTPKTYDKGGWNIPDIVYWLDVNLPKEIEL